ncbi:MAG: alkene reductase [Blastocatellia bacterium]|nr:alkene reductase [Blastocatellia bacterium]
MSHVPGPTLFSPLHLGPLELPNRIVMAPLTRCRAVDNRTPNEVMAEYYVQRASAGLIISEATQISELSYGYPHTPGIHRPDQVAGWAKITQAVHQAGGRIFLQLWHVGRAAHPSFMDGKQPVAPSPIAIRGQAHTPKGKEPYAVPRALTPADITEIVEQYHQAAENAKLAGFDGVEVHAANGYLIDEFLRSGTNHRLDEYGGSVENRTRFLLEVVKTVTDVWGGDRVGVRLSPTNAFNDITDSHPVETFTFAAQALNRFGLAYLHVLEAPPHHRLERTHEVVVTPFMRQVFKGNLMVNAGYDFRTGTEAVGSRAADLVAYGVPFIANPDLVERFRTGAPLAEANPATFYQFSNHLSEGYTDYPVFTRQQAIGG